jgi:hypothetical protein
LVLPWDLRFEICCFNTTPLRGHARFVPIAFPARICSNPRASLETGPWSRQPEEATSMRLPRPQVSVRAILFTVAIIAVTCAAYRRRFNADHTLALDLAPDPDPALAPDPDHLPNPKSAAQQFRDSTNTADASPIRPPSGRATHIARPRPGPPSSRRSASQSNPPTTRNGGTHRQNGKTITASSHTLPVLRFTNTPTAHPSVPFVILIASCSPSVPTLFHQLDRPARQALNRRRVAPRPPVPLHVVSPPRLCSNPPAPVRNGSRNARRRHTPCDFPVRSSH